MYGNGDFSLDACHAKQRDRTFYLWMGGRDKPFIGSRLSFCKPVTFHNEGLVIQRQLHLIKSELVSGGQYFSVIHTFWTACPYNISMVAAQLDIKI